MNYQQALIEAQAAIERIHSSQAVMAQVDVRAEQLRRRMDWLKDAYVQRASAARLGESKAVYDRWDRNMSRAFRLADRNIAKLDAL